MRARHLTREDAHQRAVLQPRCAQFQTHQAHAQALRDLGVDWVGTDARTTVMQATREWKAAVN